MIQIQSILPTIFSWLALGALFLDVLLCCAAYVVQLKGVGASRHYFDVERVAPRKTRIETWLSVLSIWLPIILISFVVIFLAYGFIILCLTQDELDTAMSYAQGALKILIPVLVPAFPALSGIQKADRTLFQHDNQFRRYRIRPACIVASTFLIVYALLQAGLRLGQIDQSGELRMSAVMLLLLIGAVLLSLYLIWVSIYLFCSNKQLEVAQLRKLGRHRNDAPWDLWACHYPDEQTLMFFQKYLIQYLYKQTVPFQARLERCCCIHKMRELRVSFSDAEHMRPVWYRRVLFLSWLFLMWVVLGAAAACFLSAVRIPLIYASWSLAVVQTGAVWFLSVAFLLRTELCRKIAVFNTYGSWGYYFTDSVNHKTVYSFSEREFSCSQSKRWLRAVWNIVTLFRIELTQGGIDSCSKFLEELKTAAELLPGLRRELIAVAYHLCVRLLRAEGGEDYNIPAEVTPSEFALQLCDAIWTDYTRSGGGTMDRDAEGLEPGGEAMGFGPISR